MQAGNKAIHLAIGIHNHLPAGTAASVFEETYKLAYSPFLKVLAKHPKIKVSMHYSGLLLYWLSETHPEYTSKLKDMNTKGQIEMLTGGFYEPILPSIPDRDKIGQIGRLTKYIEEHFSFTPKGMWLAERVWEPHLPKPLAESGVEYALLDENHFHYAGISNSNGNGNGLNGYYVTEEQGHGLALFPISFALQQALAKGSFSEILDIIKSYSTENGNGIICLVADSEILGSKTTSHKTLYEKGGLEKLFEKIEHSSWIKMTTFSEFRKKFPPLGRLYMPAASYPAMTEWALEAPVQREYAQLMKTAKKDVKQFLRGGMWRNFLIKYPEANNLHKKQLYVSQKVEKVKELEVKTHAQEDLWRGQTNDGYWHGLHGGLYVPNLRSSIYQNLLKSEYLVDTYLHRGGPWLDVEIMDYNKDLMDEVLINTDKLNIYLCPIHGGQLFELDFKVRACNFQAVMSRHRELYHEKVGKNSHGKVHFDWYPRYSLIDHFLGPNTSFESFSRADYKELGDFVNQAYHFDVERSHEQVAVKLWRDGHVQGGKTPAPIRIEKRVVVARGVSNFSVEFHLSNSASHHVDVWFAPEFSFSLLNPHEPGSGIFINSQTHDYSKPLQTKDANNFVIKDIARKAEIDVALSKTAQLWCFPLETLTQAEKGLERHFQGTVFLPHWKISIGPRGTWKTVVTLNLKELP